jgi:hypothetical protein
MARCIAGPSGTDSGWREELLVYAKLVTPVAINDIATIPVVGVPVVAPFTTVGVENAVATARRYNGCGVVCFVALYHLADSVADAHIYGLCG